MAKAETGRQGKSSGIGQGGIGTGVAGAGTTAATAIGNLKVFISYSRKDSEAFADELAGGLDLYGGFDVSLDRHSIVEGEEWKRRLGGLIADADTVVFIISPGSSASPVCQWEVDEAARLSKRILPVLWQAPGETTPIPERLAALNYTRFDSGRSFIAGVKALAAALNTDLDWLREHTRLLARAMEWDRGSRSDNRLMSGNDVSDAKAWAARRPVNAPELTALHLDFIRASEDAETARQDTARRQLEDMAASQAARAEALAEREAAIRQLSRRTTIGMIGLGGLAAASGGLSWWGYRAERRYRSERERAEAAQARSIDEAIRKEAARTDIAGQLVAFAAAPGQAAIATGANFSNVTLKELGAADTSVQTALSRAGVKMMEEARKHNMQQRPFLSTDMTGDIYLWQQPANRRRTAVIVAGPDFDHGALVVSTRNEKDVDGWETFLKACAFDVVRLNNPTKAELQAAAGPAEAQQAVATNTLAVFVYLGVGAHMDSDTYITASDTYLPKDRAGWMAEGEVQKVNDILVPVRDLQARLRNVASATIMILDSDLTDPRPKAKPVAATPAAEAPAPQAEPPASSEAR